MSLKNVYPRMYNSWRGMRERCRSIKRNDAHCYALKGVTVCPEWDSFDAFAKWSLLNGYSDGLTIDRINGDHGYCPGNCRWVDRKVQARNISRNRIIECGGDKKCLSEWAEHTGVSVANILARIDRLGWPVAMALFTKVGVIPTGPKPRKCT